MADKRRKGSRCCVAGCSRYQLSSPGVIFHSFPADTERRKLWTDAVHRSDSGKPPLSPTARLLICSDHFLPECYERDLHLFADAGFSTKYAKLKPDAVPSIFAGRTPSEDGTCVKRRRTPCSTYFSSVTPCVLSALASANTLNRFGTVRARLSSAIKLPEARNRETKHALHALVHFRRTWKRRSLFIVRFARTYAETAPAGLRLPTKHIFAKTCLLKQEL